MAMGRVRAMTAIPVMRVPLLVLEWFKSTQQPRWSVTDMEIATRSLMVNARVSLLTSAPTAPGSARHLQLVRAAIMACAMTPDVVCATTGSLERSVSPHVLEDPRMHAPSMGHAMLSPVCVPVPIGIGALPARTCVQAELTPRAAVTVCALPPRVCVNVWRDSMALHAINEYACRSVYPPRVAVIQLLPTLT